MILRLRQPIEIKREGKQEAEQYFGYRETRKNNRPNTDQRERIPVKSV